jgi:RHS repeat-associated protein
VTGYIINSALTPQSLSAFNAATNRIIASSYDTSGNQTQDQSGRVFVYDAENHQTNFNSGVGTYSYDCDGRRVQKTDSTGTTVFVYDVATQLIAEYHSDPVPPPAGGGGTSYLTTDHLGSTRVVTDSNGNVKARYDYLPFGEEIPTDKRPVGVGYGGGDSTRQKFTRKERDEESGLDYFLARYYSSAQGRFTSTDEFTGGPDDLFDFADYASANPMLYASPGNPQSLNKYQYCYQNPFRYIDPDGHDPLDPDPQHQSTGSIPMPAPPLTIPSDQAEALTRKVLEADAAVKGYMQSLPWFKRMGSVQKGEGVDWN